MAERKESTKWRLMPKSTLNSKELSRRMRRVEGATIKHVRTFIFKRWDTFREVRGRIALWILAIGVVIGATGLQFWWYQDDYRTTAVSRDGTYAEAVLGPLQTLNPIFSQSSAEESAGELLFSHLLRYDETGTLNYDLADRLTVSDDRKTYTVSLRTDARWSDGLYVRARDVVFTVALLQNPATRSTLSGWQGITVKAVDERTVSFELPAVYAAFPHALRFLPILPEHILRDVAPSQLRENAFSANPIGSGPFSLKLLQTIDEKNGRKVVHLTRNDTYYRGEPRLSRIQLHVYKNSESIQHALTVSEVNAAIDLPISIASQVASKRYMVDKFPTNSGVFALFNTTSPTLQDSNVRQALQLATNTDAVRRSLANDLRAFDFPILAEQFNSQGINVPKFNIQAAGQLLDKAGWVMQHGTRQKAGQKLSLSLVTTKNPDFEKVLDELSNQWRKLGITITTSVVDPSDPAQNVVQDILQPRHYDVLLYQLSIGGDPDVYAYWHSSQSGLGRNFTNYNNAIADEALSSALARVEPDLRRAKYTTFVRQWINDAPAIGLYQSTMQYVHTGSIHTLQPGVTIVSAPDRFTQVLYWGVGKRPVFTTP